MKSKENLLQKLSYIIDFETSKTKQRLHKQNTKAFFKQFETEKEFIDNIFFDHQKDYQSRHFISNNG